MLSSIVASFDYFNGMGNVKIRHARHASHSLSVNRSRHACEIILSDNSLCEAYVLLAQGACRFAFGPRIRQRGMCIDAVLREAGRLARLGGFLVHSRLLIVVHTYQSASSSCMRGAGGSGVGVCSPLDTRGERAQVPRESSAGNFVSSGGFRSTRGAAEPLALPRTNKFHARWTKTPHLCLRTTITWSQHLDPHEPVALFH